MVLSDLFIQYERTLGWFGTTISWELPEPFVINGSPYGFDRFAASPVWKGMDNLYPKPLQDAGFTERFVKIKVVFFRIGKTVHFFCTEIFPVKPKRMSIGKETKMRNDEKKLSEAIKELRQYLGLSLRAFGKPLGYSGTQITRFENDITEPTDQVMEKICEVYGVEPGYFNGEVELTDAVRKVSKEENNRIVGKRLKLARSEKGLSMKELSLCAGVSDSQICLIENGENLLTERTAAKLGKVLEVGVDWLLTGNEERKNFPVDGKMTEWLWQYPEVREELWKRMEESAE